ncbi:MAG: SIR2 family protein, partial [Deltaproteobacteria bacterium]|nr:SIR2 family protein [Deltaproteobacteria bacterium]
QKPNLSGLTLKSEFQNDSKNKNNIKNKIFYSENDLLLSKLENGNIFHIHGSVQDDKEIVMTLTDYMEYYKNNSNATILLEEIFASYTVVFVGYGLEEYEILEFMISKYKKEKTVAPRHFMLFPLFKHEENLLKFYENYYLDLGINIVHYFIDKNGYEQLSAILEEWSNIIHEYARTQYFLDRVKLIDEVVK